ncbi:MAG: helix-hairpin-helix domain-containing protein, partial [Bacteroidetes bacterium]|nr:helix-hairpin-helix domain-containing protein [Bacteroidota bacterium]
MNKIREYFTFTRSERNGILVLLVLIVILTVTPSLLDLFLKKQKVDYSQFEAEIDKFIKNSLSSNEAIGNNINLDSIKVEYFPFDPNNVTEIELYKLGLSQKLVKTWLNFRNKGGKFYDKDDVKKIYGLPDSV